MANNYIPLLPLNEVIFPEGTLSLEVSENRYLDLIRNCLKHNNSFGVIAFSGLQHAEHETPFTKTGVSLRILNVDFTRPGLMSIKALALSRFHLLAASRQNGSWMAEINYLTDDSIVELPEYLQRAKAAVLDKMNSVEIPRLTAESNTPPAHSRFNECGWVANRLGDLFDFSLQQKQLLLETSNPLLRLELAQEILLKSELQVA